MLPGIPFGIVLESWMLAFRNKLAPLREPSSIWEPDVFLVRKVGAARQRFGKILGAPRGAHRERIGERLGSASGAPPPRLEKRLGVDWEQPKLKFRRLQECLMESF